MATLNELIPRLRGYSAILVTGPQRSGTTIAAHILADELVRQYVDEEEINIANIDAARSVIARGNVVLQAPALCHVAHTLDCAVVFMRRSLTEIVRSQERIGWNGHEAGELAKYGATAGPIAAVKYRAWNEWQRTECRAGFELEYDSLQTHRLWVPPEHRRDFAQRQWGRSVSAGAET